MRIHCVSGLHGQLIAFRQISTDLFTTHGWAIVRRDDYPFSDAPYSVHLLDEYPDGGLMATCGSYDLTLEQAYARLGEVVPT